VALAGVGAVIASVAANVDAAATSCKVFFAIDLISLSPFCWARGEVYEFSGNS
jgi:hypothetical protein